MLGGKKRMNGKLFEGDEGVGKSKLKFAYNYQDKGGATWLWAEIAKRGSRTVPGLLAVLSAGDGRIRWPAVREVRRLGDGSVVGPLLHVSSGFINLLSLEKYKYNLQQIRLKKSPQNITNIK